MSALPLTYLLPIRTGPDEDLTDLAAYLADVSRHVDEVLVVDGSDPAVVDAHRRALPPMVTVVATEARTPMGKVGNVMTGLRRASQEHVVVADDDVRYTAAQLAWVDELLYRHDVVRPQNHFDPLPWHARFDTARTLLNRMTGGDWPGTLGVRRDSVLAAGGYAGDVLFENLELVRTVRAAGGSEAVPLDLIVRRLPPTTAHFRGQQVRQAYDELARPGRLAAYLAVAPLLGWFAARRRGRVVVAYLVATAALAERGRRRAGGRDAFPATASLLAGPWALWRSLTSWAALGALARGGAVYRDGRLRRAATPRRELRARVAAARGVMPSPPSARAPRARAGTARRARRTAPAPAPAAVAPSRIGPVRA